MDTTTQPLATTQMAHELAGSIFHTAGTIVGLALIVGLACLIAPAVFGHGRN